MKYVLLAVLVTAGFSMCAQEPLRAKNAPANIIALKKKKNKVSILKTMTGLTCLTAAYLAALKTQSEYNLLKQSKAFLNFGDSAASLAKGIGFSKENEHRNAKNKFFLDKCTLTAPTIAWGSATICLASIGLTSLMKGLGFAR